MQTEHPSAAIAALQKSLDKALVQRDVFKEALTRIAAGEDSARLIAEYVLEKEKKNVF